MIIYKLHRLQFDKKIIDWEWICLPTGADAAVVWVGVDLIAAMVGGRSWEERAQWGGEAQWGDNFWAEIEIIDYEF